MKPLDDKELAMRSEHMDLVVVGNTATKITSSSVVVARF